MNYHSLLETLFLDMLKLDLNEDLEECFETAMELLEHDDVYVNQAITNDDKLKDLFGFIDHKETLFIIDDTDSSIESISQDVSIDNTVYTSSDEEVPYETFRMDQDVKSGIGTSIGGERNPTNIGQQTGVKRPRDRDFYPPTTEFKINNTPYGSNVLNLECESLEERKKRIDIWAKEMSLIINTNPGSYDDQQSVLLLIDHKTFGKANKFIKDTNWAPRLEANDAFRDVMNSLYLIFLGKDYITSEALEKEKDREKSKAILDKMQLCNICDLQAFFCMFEKHMINTGNQLGYPEYIRMFATKKVITQMNAQTKEKTIIKQDCTKKSSGRIIFHLKITLKNK